MRRSERGLHAPGYVMTHANGETIARRLPGATSTTSSSGCSSSRTRIAGIGEARRWSRRNGLGATRDQVVASDWKTMPGLFACGEMVGGLFHYNYPLGTGLMSGLVFGRIAGTSAALS